MKLPVEVKNSKTGLMKIKNNDQKCFLWFHISQINVEKQNLYQCFLL